MLKTQLTALACALSLFAARPTAERTADLDDELRVLAWNVLHGANDVEQGPEKALAVIREARPDVVLLQESYDIDGERPKLGAWLAGELGWNSYQGESTHLCVLTPLEIDARFFHDAWHGVGARLTDEQGRSLVAYSIWIDYRAYITGELRDHPEMSDEELLAAESVRSKRLPQAQAIIKHLEEAGQLDLDVPLLVGGDWNTPSHMDWTLDTARVFKNRRALPLPVSLAMHGAGFGDSFRDVYPNPVQHPGITWSPMFRGDEDREQGFERIDRVYLRDSRSDSAPWRLVPTAATVYPEVWEDDEIPTAQRDFPSDHGAVLIEYQWESRPASTPTQR